MTFPTDKQSLASTRATAGTDKLSSPDHLTHHESEDAQTEGIMGKLGIRVSIPAPGTFLWSDAFSNSEWNPRPWLLNSYAIRAKNAVGAINRLIGADPSDNILIGGSAGFDNIVLTPGPNKLVKIAVLRQDITSNSYKNNSVILTGWTYKIGGNAIGLIFDNITYGITFADRPVVVTNPLGRKASAPTHIGDIDQGIDGHEIWSSGCWIQNVTTLALQGRKETGAVFTNTLYWMISWIAIGQLA